MLSNDFSIGKAFWKIYDKHDDEFKIKDGAEIRYGLVVDTANKSTITGPFLYKNGNQWRFCGLSLGFVTLHTNDFSFMDHYIFDYAVGQYFDTQNYARFIPKTYIDSFYQSPTYNVKLNGYQRSGYYTNFYEDVEQTGLFFGCISYGDADKNDFKGRLYPEDIPSDDPNYGTDNLYITTTNMLVPCVVFRDRSTDQWYVSTPVFRYGITYNLDHRIFDFKNYPVRYSTYDPDFPGDNSIVKYVTVGLGFNYYNGKLHCRLATTKVKNDICDFFGTVSGNWNKWMYDQEYTQTAAPISTNSETQFKHDLNIASDHSYWRSFNLNPSFPEDGTYYIANYMRFPNTKPFITYDQNENAPVISDIDAAKKDWGSGFGKAYQHLSPILYCDSRFGISSNVHYAREYGWYGGEPGTSVDPPPVSDISVYESIVHNDILEFTPDLYPISHTDFFEKDVNIFFFRDSSSPKKFVDFLKSL